MGRSTSSTFVRYRMGKDHFDRFFGCLLRLELLASRRHSVTLAGPVPLGPQRHRVDHPDAKVLPVACRILAGPGWQVTRASRLGLRLAEWSQVRVATVKIVTMLASFRSKACGQCSFGARTKKTRASMTAVSQDN